MFDVNNMDKFLTKTSKPRSKPDTTKYDLDETSWVVQGKLPDTLEFDFSTLWNTKPDELGSVMMYGKKVTTPRWTQSYGKSYTFSGTEHPAKPVPEPFQLFLDWANSLGYGGFHQTLVNHYIGPSHYIGPHSDNERQLVPASPIVSVSLGAERRFVLRDKKTKKIVKELKMPDKSYLVMGGELQSRYTHEVPKITSATAPAIDKRINITFRQFK